MQSRPTANDLGFEVRAAVDQQLDQSRISVEGHRRVQRCRTQDGLRFRFAPWSRSTATTRPLLNETPRATVNPLSSASRLAPRSNRSSTIPGLGLEAAAQCKATEIAARRSAPRTSSSSTLLESRCRRRRPAAGSSLGRPVQVSAARHHLSDSGCVPRTAACAGVQSLSFRTLGSTPKSSRTARTSGSTFHRCHMERSKPAAGLRQSVKSRQR